MYSFFNIYDTLKEIAEKHKQISTFGFGDIWEIASSGDITYPMLFASPDGAVYGRGEVGNKFKILVMDKVVSGEFNETDVLSDTQRILLDVMAELKNNSRDIHLRHEQITLTDFTERFDDEVAGWSADVTLWVDFDGSRCDIPTDTLSSGSPFPAQALVTITDALASPSVITKAAGESYTCTAAAACAAATVKNSDDTYNVSVASGATLNLPDITHTDSAGSSSVLPAQTAMVCTLDTRTLFFYFDSASVLNFTATIDASLNQTGTYDTETLSNVATVSYEKNGSPASLPITLADTNTLKVTITRTAGGAASVKLPGNP